MTHRATLQVKGYSNLWALGDYQFTGSTAHFEAQVIVRTPGASHTVHYEKLVFNKAYWYLMSTEVL